MARRALEFASLEVWVSDQVPLSRTKRVVFGVIALIGIPLGAIVILEGSASLLLFARDYVAAQAPRGLSRPHTVYDTLLGWVNRPNFSSPNEYGPGIGLTTTAQGFRGRRSIASPDTAGTTRLVCSGDSFTLGYGVADDQAWCALLENQFPGLQTLNMGQGAYGLDQAYLWYQRDGVRHPHKLHLFAMIDVGFERSTTGDYFGRFKPYLELQGRDLVARNVPVPPQTEQALKRAYAARILNDLRLMQLIRQVPAFDGGNRATALVEDRWPLFESVFDHLVAANRKVGSRLVLVYLPTRRDLLPGHLDARRARIAVAAQRRGITFFDLTPALRSMRTDSLGLAFISEAPSGAAPGVAGHYSSLGNAWMARELAFRLDSFPELAGLRPGVSSR